MQNENSYSTPICSFKSRWIPLCSLKKCILHQCSGFES